MPELVKPEQKMLSLRKFFDDNKSKIAAILPRHFSLDRQGQLLFTMVYKNPDLLDCTPASLVGAIMQGGMLGLEPVGPGGYWLVPFWQKANQAKNIPARRNVTMIVDYRGLMGMARRTREVKIVDWREVRAGDKFEYEYGSAGFLRHKPEDVAIHSKNGDHQVEREVTHCYAYAVLASGATVFEVMRIEDIRWHRDRYSKAAGNGPWITNEPEMGAKTCARKLSDKMPFDPLLSRAVEIDNKAELGVEENYEALLGELGDDVERAGGSAGSTKLERVVDEKKKQDEAKTNGKGGDATSSAASTGDTQATVPHAPEAKSDAPPSQAQQPAETRPAEPKADPQVEGARQPVGGAPTLSGLLDVLNTLYGELHKGTDPAKAKREREFLWSRYIGPGVDAEKADPAKVQKLIDELTAIRDKRKK